MAIKPKLNRNNSQTVRRALMILDYIGEHGAGHGCSLMELSRGVSLNKSTVLRLLEPLMESRLVEKNQQKAWYQLGVRTAFLGSLYLDSLDIRTVAAPMLRQLVNASGETVHLVFYRHPDIVYIDKLDSPNTVRMASRIGMSMPAYCTAAGKAFLA
ncbi:MAG: IclR family transcriptional regulator, partial [Segetibacter sp.]